MLGVEKKLGCCVVSERAFHTSDPPQPNVAHGATEPERRNGVTTVLQGLAFVARTKHTRGSNSRVYTQPLEDDVQIWL